MTKIEFVTFNYNNHVFMQYATLPPISEQFFSLTLAVKEPQGGKST